MDNRPPNQTHRLKGRSPRFRRSCRRIAQSVLIGLFTAYLGLVLALRLGQTRLIFFPSSELGATPAAVDLSYEEIWIPVGTGHVHGWWIPSPTEPAPALLYLHGNGSNIGDLVHRAKRLHQLGLSVLLIDYRGYGYSSAGFPSEASVYEDANASWMYLTQTRRIPPGQIFGYGQSIGGAVAIELATRQPDMAGVIVESSFTSMRAMADYVGLSCALPMDWILTQSFDSLSKVRSLQVPLLLIHGTDDKTIPARMSRELFAAAPAPKQLWLVPGADHDNVSRLGGITYLQTIQAFIAKYAAKVSP